MGVNVSDVAIIRKKYGKREKKKTKGPAPSKILSVATRSDLPTDMSNDRVCRGPPPSPEVHCTRSTSHNFSALSTFPAPLHFIM